MPILVFIFLIFIFNLIYFFKVKSISNSKLKLDYYREIPSNESPAIVGYMIKNNCDGNDVVATLLDLNYRGYINIEPGNIIGEAILEACIEVTDNFEKELYKKDKIVYAKSEHKRVYAWKLSNVKKYDEPIRAKGKLGLWNYSVEK